MRAAKSMEEVPRLRVHVPDSEAAASSTRLGPWTRLSELFAQSYLPQRLAKARGTTKQGYQYVVNRWVRETGDPPLEECDNDLFERFLSRLDDLIEPTSVNHYRRHLRALFVYAGPPGHRRDHALGLVERAAWAAPRDEDPPERGQLDGAHIVRLYEACGSVPRSPSYEGVAPGDYWQALYLMELATGVRIWSTLRWVERGMLDAASGEFHATKAIMKGKRRKTFVLHARVWQALARLKHEHPLVFHWPGRQRGTEASRSWFYDVWREIQHAAGVPKPRAQHGWHALRRHHLSAVWEKLGDKHAQAAGAHRDFSTTRGYLDPRKVAAQVASVVELPGEERQGMLF